MGSKHITIELYNKLGDKTKTRRVIATREEPKIIAKNWYQINTNKTLEAIIKFKGNIRDFQEFDSVRVIGDRNYIINAKMPDGRNGVRMEVVRCVLSMTN